MNFHPISSNFTSIKHNIYIQCTEAQSIHKTSQKHILCFILIRLDTIKDKALFT